MGRSGQRVLRAVTWPLAPALLAGCFTVSAARSRAGGPLLGLGDVPFVIAPVACWLVGVVLTWRVFRQGAGWAFLGLGTALAWSSVSDVSADYLTRWRAGAEPPRLLLALSDSSFVWWFVFLGLVIQLTPPTGLPVRLPRRLPQITLAAGVAFQVAALLRSTPLDKPYESFVSPWAVESLAGPIAGIAFVAIMGLGVILVLSVCWLVRAWRRAAGASRQQLLWLVAGAAPLAPCVVASFAVSTADHEEVAGVLLSLSVVALAIGAALSVLRYRLYDVERVVTDSVAYAIAAATVSLTFGVVVIGISRTTPISPTSQLPTVLATLAGAATARASYVWGHRAVERRLNRVRFDAVASLRTGLAAGTPDLDALLAAALRDPMARVLYPAEDGTWVSADGRAAPPDEAAVEVRRRGAVTAKLEFDPRRNERAVVEAVAQEAAAEIDNAGLRAELSRQVELINESRARIAAAHVEERRRIERDLHDGAQQRLLAMALQLQSARVNGKPHVLQAEVTRAIAELGATVQELRDLAAGLQPAALAGGGLLAAVADLAVRCPLPLDYDVVDRRFPTDIESAAWFVIAEATTNAVKHAGCERVQVCADSDGSTLRVAVRDDGLGGATASGHGLQGLADRVAALHGRLLVQDVLPHGTLVEAELPCGS
jgi:signal transduction histidine kinase